MPRLCPGTGEFGDSLSDRRGVMRFLADENVPIGVVEELSAARHNVEWVSKLAPGALDVGDRVGQRVRARDRDVLLGARVLAGGVDLGRVPEATPP